MKRKISITTGSRSDYGLLRPILKKISSSKKLDLYLIAAGMHLTKKYGLTINEIKKDGFKIYARVNMVPKDDSAFFLAKSLGEGIIQFSKIFMKLKPDINVVLGDRDEMLASALAASHMNIFNAHIHGGEVSGSLDEYNRHAITKISVIHFAATKKSRERIIKMGENPKNVFLAGSPAVDEVINNKITPKQELEKIYGMKFKGDEIILLQHPVTTRPEESGIEIQNTLNSLIKFKKRIIAIAPNSDTGNNQIFRYLQSYSNKYDFIKMYRSIPRSDYMGLLKNCGVLVGNSSSGLIEASYFNIPVVNIGMRQKNRERGKNVFDVEKSSTNLIYQTVKHALKIKRKRKFKNEYVYGNGTASAKIVKYLESVVLNKELLEKQLLY
ncbi:MAG: UDP-N-acetylglucosamine 2-epimerase (hydrolyzing) [Thaumarchaeota archaeon]|nr:MAG: UDP-N-acetylglucosamine 2-epimerase (hydrolyzing) [Nitrososphaerota archaeon]